MIDPNRIFKLLDDFFAEGMTFEGMEKLHRELEDEFDRQFFNTLKKTVELCQCIKQEEVPEGLHYRVLRVIEQTPQECLEAEVVRKPAADKSVRPAKRKARKRARRKT